MLHKVTRGNSERNKIRHIKYKGYESYYNITEYVYKYGAEGGSVTSKCYRINTLNVRKFNVGVLHTN